MWNTFLKDKQRRWAEPRCTEEFRVAEADTEWEDYPVEVLFTDEGCDYWPPGSNNGVPKANFWNTFLFDKGFVLDFGCRFGFTAVELKNSQGQACCIYFLIDLIIMRCKMYPKKTSRCNVSLNAERAAAHLGDQGLRGARVG